MDIQHMGRRVDGPIIQQYSVLVWIGVYSAEVQPIEIHLRDKDFKSKAVEICSCASTICLRLRIDRIDLPTWLGG
jgi:hypothetical protein